MSFDKKSLKKLEKKLNVYGGASKQIICDACGQRSLLSSSMLEKFKDEKGAESKIYCPKCGKVIRTTDFFSG